MAAEDYFFGPDPWDYDDEPFDYSSTVECKYCGETGLVRAAAPERLKPGDAGT